MVKNCCHLRHQTFLLVWISFVFIIFCEITTDKNRDRGKMRQGGAREAREPQDEIERRMEEQREGQLRPVTVLVLLTAFRKEWHHTNNFHYHRKPTFYSGMVWCFPGGKPRHLVLPRSGSDQPPTAPPRASTIGPGRGLSSHGAFFPQALYRKFPFSSHWIIKFP